MKRKWLQRAAALCLALPGLPDAHAYRGITVESAVTMEELGASPPSVTADGRWIAFAVHPQHPAFRLPETFEKTGVPASWWEGSSIMVRDTTGETALELTKGWGTSWGATWSPDGRDLAFYSDKNGRVRLWVWKREANAFTEYAQCAAAPQGTADQVNRIQWSADSARVFFRIWSKKPAAKPASGDEAEAKPIVWDSGAAGGEGEGKDGEGPDGNDRSGDYVFGVAAANVATGSVEVLLRRADFNNFVISPNGAFTAAFGNSHQAHPTDPQALLDLYLIRNLPLETLALGNSDADGNLRATAWETKAEPTVIRDVRQWFGEQLSFSPDSTKLAWCTLGALSDNDIYYLEVPGGKPTNLTGDIGKSKDTPRLNFSTGKKFGERLSRRYWRLLWTGNSAHLVVAAEASGEVWLLSTDGTPAKKVFQRPAPRGQVRILAPASRDEIKSPKPDQIVVETAESGEPGKWWTVSLNGEGLPSNVARSGARLRDASPWQGSGTPDMIPLLTEGATFVDWASTDDLMIVRRKDSADLWMARGMSSDMKLRPISHLDDENHFGELGTARWLVSKVAGRDLRSLLLLPMAGLPAEALAKEGAKAPPLVVWVYAGKGAPSEASAGSDSQYNGANTLLKKGYAVLFADIPVDGTGNATRSILDPVMAEVGAAVGTGSIDETRIGVFGWSNGGYTVDTLIAHSDRFKAAVSVAGYADVISFYLGGRTKEAQWMAGVQTTGGQPGLAVGLWRDPLRYVDNSPIAFLNDVSTPLLLIHGDKDESVPMDQSFEMYHGLVSLGKRVRFVQYPGEGHAIDSSAATTLDLWRRIQDWYDQFIGPAASRP